MSTRTPVRRASAKPARPAAPAAGRKPAGRAPRAAAASTAPAAFYVPESYKPEESVGYLMRRILATVATEIEREMEPNGLTNAQWIPLFKLSIGSASTVAELARECQLDAGAMTRLLDRLEAKASTHPPKGTANAPIQISWPSPTVSLAPRRCPESFPSRTPFAELDESSNPAITFLRSLASRDSSLRTLDNNRASRSKTSPGRPT